MKKATINLQSLSRGWMILSIMAWLICGAFTASAESYSGPAVSYFYPAATTPPQQTKSTASLYVYFATGSKIKSAKASIVQNGETLGTCTYTGTATGTYYATMKPTSPENADIALIEPGEYTLKVYEVDYLVDGETIHWSDIDNPIGEVTYLRPGESATVVSETGLEDRTVKSYYPADGTEGVKTFTFSKPINGSNIKGYFNYGYGDMPVTTELPLELSADGLTLTIDLRGKCYNAAVLANGQQFFDVTGDPLPYPEIVNIEISGLKSMDGSGVTTVTTDADGNNPHTLSNRFWLTYHYVDLTFETPVLAKAEFYSSANPSKRYLNINATTDMMDLTVDDAEVIESADMLLKAGEVEATIGNADIDKTGNVYTVGLPASIKEAGSDNLVISLEGVTYNIEDGVEHVIAPFDLANVAKEKTTIAEVKALPAGSEVILISEDGVKVSYSNSEIGYTFIEDDNDGLQVIGTKEGVVPFHDAMLVQGRICGTYQGYGILQVNVGESDFTETPTDVEEGTLFSDLDKYTDGSYYNRLMTFVAGNDCTIDYIEGVGAQIKCGDAEVMAVFDLVEGFAAPAVMENLTGVLYHDSAADLLIVRRMSDINREITPKVSSLGELFGLESGTAVNIELAGAKVTFSDEDTGVFVMEDESGCVMVYSADDEGDLLLNAGVSISGTIKGTYAGDHILVIDPESMEVEMKSADILKGVAIDLDEVSSEANYYRLVTFTHSEETPLTSDGFSVNVADRVSGVDFFGVLDDDFTFPDAIKSITGILLPPMNVNMGAEADGEESPVALMAFRTAEDIEANESSAIETVETGAGASKAVYDIRGIKVGEATEGLAPGIYVVGGKKILVK